MKEDKRLALLVAFHDSHQQAVNVHMPKNCLPGDGWEIWKSGEVTVDFDGRPVTVNQYFIAKENRRMVVLYWYQTRNRVIANEIYAKLMLVRDALFESRTSGTFVRIVVRDDPKAVAEGLEFSGALMPQVASCFRP